VLALVLSTETLSLTVFLALFHVYVDSKSRLYYIDSITVEIRFWCEIKIKPDDVTFYLIV